MICFPVHCTPCLFWENTACQVGHPPVVFCTPGNRLHGSWHFNFNGLDMFCWFCGRDLFWVHVPQLLPPGICARRSWHIWVGVSARHRSVGKSHIGRDTEEVPTTYPVYISLLPLFCWYPVLEKLWFLQVWDVTSWISFASLAAVMWLACKGRKVRIWIACAQLGIRFRQDILHQFVLEDVLPPIRRDFALLRMVKSLWSWNSQCPTMMSS